MTTQYDHMKIYNPSMTKESYRSLVDALRDERDRVYGTNIISEVE